MELAKQSSTPSKASLSTNPMISSNSLEEGVVHSAKKVQLAEETQNDFIVDKGDRYELDYSTAVEVTPPRERGLHFKILAAFTILLIIFQITGTIVNKDSEFVDIFVTFLITLCVLMNLYIVYLLNIQFSIDMTTRLKLYPCVFVAILILIFPWGYVSSPNIALSALDSVVITIIILFVTFVCYGVTIEAVGIYSTIEICLSDTRSRLVYTDGRVKHFVFREHIDNDEFEDDNVKRLMSKYL